MERYFLNSLDVYQHVIEEVVRICKANPHVHTNVRELQHYKDGVDCNAYDDGVDAKFIVCMSLDVYRMLQNEVHMVCGSLEHDIQEGTIFAGRPVNVVKNRTNYVKVLIEY